MSNDRDDSTIDVVQGFLEARGWISPEPRGIRWVDHCHRASQADLWVRFLPELERLVFDVRFNDVGARLGVYWKGDPTEVLEAIAAYDVTLTPSMWPEFVEALGVAAHSLVSIEPEGNRFISSSTDAASLLFPIQPAEEEWRSVLLSGFDGTEAAGEYGD